MMVPVITIRTGMNEFVAMHKFLSAMRDSFYYFDRDRSNSLDFQELHQALMRSGYQLSYQVSPSIAAQAGENADWELTKRSR